MSPANQLSPSRGSILRVNIRCKWLGETSASRNAAIVNAAKSCRRRRCWRKRRHQPTPKLIMPWPAISAGAVAISASMRLFAPPQGGHDMTHHRNQENVVIANVSRRDLLKGVAATGAFVLAAQFPAVRSAMAYATGADKMAHGVVTNPHIFV